MPGQGQILSMRQACDDHALIRLDAIPNPEREMMHGCAAMLARTFDDLILEGVLTDTGQRAQDLFNEAIAQTRIARFVAVLSRGDIGFGKWCDPNRTDQRPG